MKYTILKITLAVWVGIWLFFVARELVIKDNLRDYKALIGKSLEDKHAYITGERLYAFLKLCKANLPPRATYRLVGVEEGSIEKRRAVYYLYPLLEGGDPEFILVYGAPGVGKDGYMMFAEISGSGYIMKKMKAR
jgi:hypothetical protein